MSDRGLKAIGAGASAPTAETLLAFSQPPQPNPPSIPIVIRGDVPLIGAASVTAVTLRIRRGNGVTGTLLATGVFTVTGAQTVPGNLSFIDTAADGTGYSFTVQATGATATCGPGHLETQPGQSILGRVIRGDDEDPDGARRRVRPRYVAGHARHVSERQPARAPHRGGTGVRRAERRAGREADRAHVRRARYRHDRAGTARLHLVVTPPLSKGRQAQAREAAMRVTLAGVIVGALLYWGLQHFTGIGNTGKASA